MTTNKYVDALYRAARWLSVAVEHARDEAVDCDIQSDLYMIEHALGGIAYRARRDLGG